MAGAGQANSGTAAGAFPLVLGQAVAFLPPLDPSAAAVSLTATDAAGNTASLVLPVYSPLYGSYTFALRGYLPVTWDAGPRAMVDVPPAGEVSPSTFAALTSSLAEGLNLMGGFPLTRLTATASPGDATFHIERAAGLSPTGHVQVDGVTYAYASLTAGSPPSATGGAALAGLSVARSGQAVAGVQASHLAGAQVAFTDAPVSDLVNLRNAFFLDTAEGPFLTTLGRNLGVLHSPAVRDDDQYRALIKAIAYGPKTSIYGISLALDALLGPGNYTLSEDPIGAPCQVQISVAYGALADPGSFGKSYIDDLQPAAPAGDGSIPLSGPVFGIGPVYGVSSAGVTDRATDLAVLTGTATCASDSANPLNIAGGSLPAPLVTLPFAPLPSDIGSNIHLTSGANKGHYSIAQIRSSNRVAVSQGIFGNVAIANYGGNLRLNIPVPPGQHAEGFGPFTYPQDIGRKVVLAPDGQVGTIATILDAGTGQDLSALATPLAQRSNVAVISGAAVSPQAGATVAIVPAFVSASAVPFRMAGAYVETATTGQDVKLTRRVALTSPPASYAVAASDVLSAQVISDISQTTNVSATDPPTLDQYPLYLDTPFAVLEDYLSDLTAAGVRPVVEFF